LSPDGQHYAYTARFGDDTADKNNRDFIVLDGKRIESEDGNDSLVFISDNRLAYQTMHNHKKAAVIDGKKGDEYQYMGDLLVSPDRKHAAYWGRRDDDKYVVYLDGKLSGPMDGIDRLSFAPDGARLAYWSKQGTQWFAIVGEEKSGPYDESEMKSTPAGDTYQNVRAPIKFSPDGKHTALCVRIGAEWFVVVDGKKSAPHERIAYLSFTPDGRVRYTLQEKGQETDLEDGKPYDHSDRIVYSPAGPRTAHVRRVETKLGTIYAVSLDGQTSESYAQIENISFSPVTNRLVYVGLTGTSATLVIEGQKPEVFDTISDLSFSPDGEKAGFVEIKGRELWWRVRKVRP
jgi:hypothetical protein